MTEFERGVLAALRGIERALKAPERPEEGIVAQEPVPVFTSPQGGAQRLTEDTVWPYGLPEAHRQTLKDEAAAQRLLASGGADMSPRLVEKLLNPEDH